MKKIIMLGLFIILLTIKVSAKEVIINGQTYNTESTIEGDGFLYDNNTKTLYLDNYYGEEIMFNEDLNLNIKGNCVIKKENGEYGIKGKNIAIYGVGTLYITGTDIGIKTDYLTINNLSLLYLNNNEIGLDITNDLKIIKTKIFIKKAKIGINYLNSFFVSDAMINIYSDKGLVSNNNSVMEINKSNFLIISTNEAIYKFKEGTIIDSTIKLKAQVGSIYGGNINYVGDFLVYTSTNDLDYYLYQDYNESNYYYNYQYLIISKNEPQDLLDNDDSLIIQVDESVLENNNNNNTDDPTEIIENPSTLDNIWLYVNIFVISLIVLVFFLKRKNNYGKS